MQKEADSSDSSAGMGASAQPILPELLQPITVCGPAGIMLRIIPEDNSFIAEVSKKTLKPLVHLTVETGTGKLAVRTLHDNDVLISDLRQYLEKECAEQLVEKYLPAYARPDDPAFRTEMMCRSEMMCCTGMRLGISILLGDFAIVRGFSREEVLRHVSA